MRQDSVISVERFEDARARSGDRWSDWEVFDEERDDVSVRDIVYEVVEGQYTHPAGPDSLYGLEGSAQDLVWDKVFSSGLVPSGVPEDVRKRFARDLGSEVSELSVEVYCEVRDEVDPEGEVSLDEVRDVLGGVCERMVSDGW